MFNSVWRPSRNYSPGPRAVLGAVLHSTEGGLAGSLAALTREGGPSAHYVIDTDGTAYQLVSESDVAYHVAAFGNDPSLNRNRPLWLPPYNGRYSAVNACTIGYELVGYAARGFTGAQYRMLGVLLVQAAECWQFPVTLLPDDGPAARVVTHGWLQTDRSDPGLLFDWQALRDAIGAVAVSEPAASETEVPIESDVEEEDAMTDDQRAILEMMAALGASAASISDWLSRLGRAAELGRALQAPRMSAKARKAIGAELATFS